MYCVNALWKAWGWGAGDCWYQTMFTRSHFSSLDMLLPTKSHYLLYIHRTLADKFKVGVIRNNQKVVQPYCTELFFFVYTGKTESHVRIYVRHCFSIRLILGQCSLFSTGVSYRKVLSSIQSPDSLHIQAVWLDTVLLAAQHFHATHNGLCYIQRRMSPFHKFSVLTIKSANKDNIQVHLTSTFLRHLPAETLPQDM